MIWGMASASPGTSDLAFEAALRHEKASALGRVGSRVEALLAQLKEIERLVAQGSGLRAELVERHAAVREQAKLQLWYLIVQREAMGLNRHHDVYRIYEIPPKLY